MKAIKLGRKVLIVFGSLTLFLGGLALLVLPGPGLLVIVASLLLLGTEFDWAKRMSDRLKLKITRKKDR